MIFCPDFFFVKREVCYFSQTIATTSQVFRAVVHSSMYFKFDMPWVNNRQKVYKFKTCHLADITGNTIDNTRIIKKCRHMCSKPGICNWSRLQITYSNIARFRFQNQEIEIGTGHVQSLIPTQFQKYGLYDIYWIRKIIYNYIKYYMIFISTYGCLKINERYFRDFVKAFQRFFVPTFSYFFLRNTNVLFFTNNRNDIMTLLCIFNLICHEWTLVKMFVNIKLVIWLAVRGKKVDNTGIVKK